MTQHCGFPDSDSSIASIYPTIKLSVNSIGLACALVAVLFVAFFRKLLQHALVLILGLVVFSPKLIDRVTLRLQAAISLVDIARHIVFFYSCRKEVNTCPIIGFFRILGDHIYFTLNFSIALNMQLIFLHKLHPHARWEMWYWVCSLFSPLFVDLFLLYKQYFGRTRSGVCLLKASTSGITFRSIHISFSYLITVYCLCVACLVIRKLKRSDKPLDFMSHYLYKNNLVSREVVKDRMVEIILKSTYYPLTCFLSLFFYNIYIIIEEIENVCSSIILLAMFGLAFTGVLNLLAFLADPLFRRAFTNVQVIFMNRFGFLARATIPREVSAPRVASDQGGVIEIYLDPSCFPYLTEIEAAPNPNDDFVAGYLEFA